MPPKFLEHAVILCLERRYPEQNSVIRLKSNILPPPAISGLATLMLQSQCGMHIKMPPLNLRNASVTEVLR